MNNFQELLAEIQGDVDTLAKALPEDDSEGDAKIAAAAADGEAGQGEGEPDGDEGEGGKGDGDGDEKPAMKKSMTVTLEDGSQAEAIDAGELIKSLQDEVAALGGKLAKSESDTSDKLGQTLELVKNQMGLIKSLSEQVQRLGGAGRGRKATVVVQDQPTMAKSLSNNEPEGLKPEELMAKAMSNVGKTIMAHEVSALEGYLHRGTVPPEQLVKKALGQ